MGKILYISTSEKKGVQKSNVDKANMIDNFGIEGDAHAGKWHRQVSFLAEESIDKMRKSGIDVSGGDFAENITTEGVDLVSMKVGERLKVGDVEFTISQLGKLCHNKCAIYYAAGTCVMPREGIFGVVSGNGEIKVGDEVEKLPKKGLSAAVITLSDKGSRGERVDETGPMLVEYLKENLNVTYTRLELIPDDKEELRNTLKYMSELQGFDIIITNGSTGVAPRDIAPDVTLELIERRLPGFEEAMRMESYKKVATAITSRAVCGTMGSSLVINLPGSPKAARENFEAVAAAVEHTVKKLQGDPTDCAQQ
ncbi:MOSC domain-containing protein [Limisalsivibrio acetivorans]|uniref:MOSC domain-containing protein n=1 Tax=Limisalsivibrio acetivorans TaxID=1304888 RepID=UPI0003B5B700|nr:MOSC domain-containing protein [Limisalsivibrio acetivorans]